MTQRSPPPSELLQSKVDRNTLSASSSDITKDNLETNNFIRQTTQRTKRPRSKCFSDDDSCSDLSTFKEDLLSSIKSMMASQSTRLDQLENRMKAIQNQNTNIQSTNKDIEKAMNHLSEDIRNMECKLTSLEEERHVLDQQILSMENKLENLEIASIKTCIELRNVPKISKEKKADLYDYIHTLCDTIQLPIQKSDIRDVQRLPSKKEQAHSSISVELMSTLTKSLFLEAVKKYNKNHPTDNINTAHLGLSAPKKQIFISELLTPKMKRLLFLARDFSKTYNYTFVWPSNGRIYIRKEEGKPYIMLRKEAHLTELKKTVEIPISK